jgi:hypothetical protein
MAAQHPGRQRNRGRQPGEPGHRELAAAARQHEVAEPPPAQDRGVRDQAGVREHRPGRRDLRPHMRERCAVRHVGGEDPAVGKRQARGRGELRRGQVRRRPAARENIGDDHVEGARRELLKHRASVADANPDAAA